MNLSPAWVSVFQEAGIEAAHWSGLGNPAAGDREIFEFARSRGSIIFTNDLDFGAILSEVKGRTPSVVQIRTGDVSPRAQGARVVAALREFARALSEGAIVTIKPGSERIRVLPLRDRVGS